MPLGEAAENPAQIENGRGYYCCGNASSNSGMKGTFAWGQAVESEADCRGKEEDDGDESKYLAGKPLDLVFFRGSSSEYFGPWRLQT